MKGNKQDWLKDQVDRYKSVFNKYEEYRGILEKILNTLADKYAPLGFVQTRTKSIPSFADKILRKNTPRRDPVNEFTDLCGARIVATTHAEVNAICEFIEDFFTIDWENSIDVSQRYKPEEFGYRSVHYIVSLKNSGSFPLDKEIKIPRDLMPKKNRPMKAEIQVRTLLEHAWAVFTHDRIYKSNFKIPDKWLRELAAVAAVLEESDRSFERIRSGIHAYASNYRAYMSKDQILEEIERLENVLFCDPDNAEITARLSELANSIGHWDKTIDLLSPLNKTNNQTLLKNLAVALIKKNNHRPKSREYKKGQAYLEKAAALAPADAECFASLGGSWKGLDEQKSQEYYRRAFEIDPTDPYALENYLTCEVLQEKKCLDISLLSPLINTSIGRCHEQIEVGINMPWAFFSLGKFYLFLQKPYQSLLAYARAVQISPAPSMIDTSLISLNQLSCIKDDLPGFDWAQRVLLLGSALKNRTAIDEKKNPALAMVKSLKTEKGHHIDKPVVIIAGGCDVSVEHQMQEYKELLIYAFRDFSGTLISGGTTQGISGVAGSLRSVYSDRIHTIGYLPINIPSNAVVDKDPLRYQELRYTQSSGFTPMEPLQNWIDIFASGINPSEVKVLGINGGTISSAEYRIALAMGAQVGIIEESGREAERLLIDPHWMESGNLYPLPSDPETVRAYIGTGLSPFPIEDRESIAKHFHESHRQSRMDNIKQGLTDKDDSLAEWENLSTFYKDSNIQAADHIYNKLKAVGCSIHRVKENKTRLISFTDEEIEIMSRMEHGRWNAERIKKGWRWGEIRDEEKKEHPCLVSWAELSDEIKALDRNQVREIPSALAAIGLEIRREK